MVTTPINHICLDERGIAYIVGSSIKVASIVVDATTWAMSPQEIQENYPMLSLSQVYTALAYYHDHKAEIDTQLAAWNAEYEELRRAAPNPLTRAEWEERRRRQQADGSC